MINESFLIRVTSRPGCYEEQHMTEYEIPKIVYSYYHMAYLCFFPIYVHLIVKNRPSFYCILIKKLRIKKNDTNYILRRQIDNTKISCNKN